LRGLGLVAAGWRVVRASDGWLKIRAVIRY